jgi:hypothetical protein
LRCGRLQQIHCNKAVGHSANHLVAVGPNRREIDKIIEEAERGDGRKRLRLAAEEKSIERLAHIILRLSRPILVRKILHRHPQHIEAVAPARLGKIELAKLAQGRKLQRIAAPAETQGLKLGDCDIARHEAVCESAFDLREAGARRDALVAAALERLEYVRRGAGAAFGGGHFAARKFGFARECGRQIGRQMRQCRIRVRGCTCGKRSLSHGDACLCLPGSCIAAKNRFSPCQRLSRRLPVHHSGVRETTP